jgi:branched-chain amino acid transport system ATP-binding protein
MGVSPAGHAGADRGPARLEVRGLTVRFGGLVALDAVSLDIPAGQVVGVIGPNGAGKTTLFNVVCGLQRAHAGDVVYEGERINGIAPYRLNGLGIARTVQGLGLWRGMTVLENVMTAAKIAPRPGFGSALLGLPRSDRYESGVRAAALDQLRELGIADVANRYPPTLPYGVQKWVALARAMATRPRLLLLDEPASGLTAEEMNVLGGLLARLRERVSIALVEHRLDLVMTVCERVHVLDFGRVIASGTPAEVQNDRAVTDAYLGEELPPAAGDGA